MFGPEDTGLVVADLERCDLVCTIELEGPLASLNLAQAVAICCYELHTHYHRSTATRGGASPPEAAPFADQERMFGHLQEALEAVGYLYGTKADPLMHAVRHLLGRSLPTPQEVKLLHGLARQLLWVAKHRRDDPGGSTDNA